MLELQHVEAAADVRAYLLLELQHKEAAADAHTFLVLELQHKQAGDNARAYLVLQLQHEDAHEDGTTGRMPLVHASPVVLGKSWHYLANKIDRVGMLSNDVVAIVMRGFCLNFRRWSG